MTKQYCGKAKLKGTQYGELYSLSFSPQDLETITKNANSGGWVNLIMTLMRHPDSRGNTFTLYIDEWAPQKQESTSTPYANEEEQPQRERASGMPTSQFGPPPTIEEDEIPF